MNTTAIEIEPVAIGAWSEERMIYLELRQSILSLKVFDLVLILLPSVFSVC